MAAAVALRSGGMEKQSIDTGKYVRYTTEQVEALERLYAECPKPSSMRRQQLIRECPILANIESKQIKVWFQNRRCREKQRTESCRLQALNRKLSAMNKLLMEENERLQKQVNQLVHENAIMRQQIQNVSLANDTSCESVMTNPQNPLRDANNPAGLLSIAEEALAEFLAKATGTAVDWVQMPGMKPGPDSVGIVAISHSACGVAARACGLVNMEAGKIADIFKDKPSWFHDCRNHEVFTMFPTGNGGTIELVYMQMYAPTTLAPARDLWTLRYTTSLEDGSLVICEKSLSGGGPISTTSHQFVRAVMLPSGCLIRPCEGGGSIVHIVDHLDLEASSVPEVLRPLYVSSNVVAQKMTVTALRHVKQIAQEVIGDVAFALGREPAILRSFSQRLHRGFNDAINGFNDDGWSLIETDGMDVVVATNVAKKIGIHAIPANAFVLTGGVLCAKASMLLQSVPPALLVRFLREHRSEWADYNLDAYSAASLKTGVCSFPGSGPTKFSGSQTIMPLAHTIENEESLEVVRLEGEALSHGAILSRNIHLLQICYGIDDNSLGTCFQLVFAPIDEHFPDDVPLLASGFRVMPLDTKTNGMPSTHTLDLASSLGASSGNQSAGDHKSTDYYNTRSILTIAFQFPYEAHLQDSIAAMARQYVRSVVSSVQRVSMALTQLRPGHNIGNKQLPGSPDAVTLAHWIYQSYKIHHLGMDLLRNDARNEESLLKTLWHHQDAILCCSFELQPVFTFANQAGLDMLETTLVALQDITLDKIFDEAGLKQFHSGLVKLMEQGYMYLPAGVCCSGMGRHVSFEQAIAWKVLREDNNAHCVALCFVNWSFL